MLSMYCMFVSFLMCKNWLWSILSGVYREITFATQCVFLLFAGHFYTKLKKWHHHYSTCFGNLCFSEYSEPFWAMKLVRRVVSLLSVPTEIKTMGNGNYETDQLTNLQLTSVLKHNKYAHTIITELRGRLLQPCIYHKLLRRSSCAGLSFHKRTKV